MVVPPVTKGASSLRLYFLFKSVGRLAMLLAMRRASSSVSTEAVCASPGFSRAYTYARDCW